MVLTETVSPYYGDFKMSSTFLENMQSLYHAIKWMKNPVKSWELEKIILYKGSFHAFD